MQMLVMRRADESGESQDAEGWLFAERGSGLKKGLQMECSHLEARRSR